MSEWTAAELPAMDGRRVVVTGANSGIGFAATEAFARAGATVEMACRSRERGRRAAGEIRAVVPEADLTVRACDLADQSSVADCAREVRADGPVDVLCNNAGVMAIPRRETADGFERQFGVNHLGHFALTGHLLPALAASDGESRVVTQSSGAHRFGRIDFEDLHGTEDYGKWAAYGQSKLANLLFAFELDRRLERADLGVHSLACHPGYADTNLQFRGPEAEGSRLKAAAVRLGNALFGQSPEGGALPMLYAAAAPGAEGGAYYGPGGLLRARGAPERQEPSPRARDSETARRLWAVSEDLTGVSYEFEAVTRPG